jgi:hypothetical protein
LHMACWTGCILYPTSISTLGYGVGPSTSSRRAVTITARVPSLRGHWGGGRTS